jgi:hypothetical protein
MSIYDGKHTIIRADDANLLFRFMNNVKQENYKFIQFSVINNKKENYILFDVMWEANGKIKQIVYRLSIVDVYNDTNSIMKYKNKISQNIKQITFINVVQIAYVNTDVSKHIMTDLEFLKYNKSEIEDIYKINVKNLIYFKKHNANDINNMVKMFNTYIRDYNNYCSDSLSEKENLRIVKKYDNFIDFNDEDDIDDNIFITNNNNSINFEFNTSGNLIKFLNDVTNVYIIEDKKQYIISNNNSFAYIEFDYETDIANYKIILRGTLDELFEQMGEIGCTIIIKELQRCDIYVKIFDKENGYLLD